MSDPSAISSAVSSLVGQIAREGQLPAPPAGDAPGAVPFADLLEKAVTSANIRAQAAEEAGAAFASGTTDDIHGTMIALKKADIETKLVVTVRNKLLDAWNDLWRMPL